MDVEPGGRRVVLAHEDIPHFMKAMTMGFSVRDSSILKGVEVGDSISGVIVLQQSETWLDSVIVFRRAIVQQ